MIKVYVKKQSSYPVSVSRLKSELISFLESQGIVSDATIEIGIVGEAKMYYLAEKYLKERKVLHNVLSFPASESKERFIMPPDSVIHLGEVVICYPKVTEEANDEGVLIDDKVIELVKHGTLHLLGIHHD